MRRGVASPASPLRAVLDAHAQQAWNSLMRQTGALGGAASLLTAVIVLFGLAPILLLGFGFGYAMGGMLAAEATRLIARAWLTGFHAAIVLCFGIWGGLTQVVRFDWGTFRTYPVSPARLFWAELLLSPLDLAPLFAIALFGTLAVGFGVQRVALFPGALVLAFCGVLSTIAVKTIVGGAKKALLLRVSTLRISVALGAVAALVLSVSLRRGSEAFSVVGTILEWLERNLPSGRAYAALGRLGPSLVNLPAAIAFTLAWLLLAIWVHARVSRLEPHVPSRGPGADRLWSFGTPRFGIARLTLAQLRGAATSRLLFLIPFTAACGVAVVARIPALPFGEQLARLPSGFPWLTAVFVWCLLICSGVFWNQYGLDRHGIKTLLLMPISLREIVLGKLLTLAVVTTLVSLAAVVPLLTVLPLSAPVLVHALGAAPATFLFLAGAGHIVSVRFPRRESGEPKAMPAPLALLTSVLSIFMISALVVVHRSAASFGRWGAAVTMLAAGLLVFAAYLLTLPALERALVRGQERLVEELG